MTVSDFVRRPTGEIEAADRAAVSEALGHLVVAGGGRIDPRDLLIAAASPAHALHGYIDWDADPDSRINQARQIIVKAAIYLGGQGFVRAREEGH